jgi:DNA-binding NarL/FixJ family response regulator
MNLERPYEYQPVTKSAFRNRIQGALEASQDIDAELNAQTAADAVWPLFVALQDECLARMETLDTLRRIADLVMPIFGEATPSDYVVGTAVVSHPAARTYRNQLVEAGADGYCIHGELPCDDCRESVRLVLDSIAPEIEMVERERDELRARVIALHRRT